MALFQRIRTSLAPIAPEAEAPAVGGPGSAGELLRQQRLALGLDLGEISAALHIKTAYLAALEDGRPDRLPGPAYAIGFLRAYGDHLGLDGTEIVRRFRRETAGFTAKPDLSFPIPLDERGIPSGVTLLAALLLTILGYGTWYYLSSAEHQRPERVSEVPAGLLPPRELPAVTAPHRGAAATGGTKAAVRPIGGPANPAPTEPAATSADLHPSPAPAGIAPITTSPAPAPLSSPGSAPAPASMTAATPASSPQVAVTPGPAAAASPATSTRDAEANPAAATQTNPAPANPAPANSVPANRAPANSVPGDAAASSAVRIVVQATADSWIEVRDQNHAILFTGVLKPGERYLVPDHPGISMRTGNAGGLEMTVDGKLQPPLGPSGAIRNVALDPQTSSGATAAQ